MISLTGRLKAVLTNQKGETIMEGIVSLLIFSILMMTVTAMLQTAMHITKNSIADARIRQDSANEALLEDYDNSADAVLTLTDSTGKDVSIPVNVSVGDYFTAFAPE